MVHLRPYLRQVPGWVTMSRLRHEGWTRAFHRWRLWSQILDTRPIETAPARPGAAVELHLLCRDRDHLCALWALKTFYYFSGASYPLVVHLHGPVPRRVLARFGYHFPNARLIQQAEADHEVERCLAGRGLVRIAEARRCSPFMLKLTDFPVMSQAVHLLTLDSDVLFFRRPAELLVATETPLSVSLFQRDPASTYNLSEERALAELGVPLAPCVNTGIALFPRDSLDLSRCERYLAHPDVARPSGWIEQTLQALCASEQGRVRYLPDSYLLSLESEVPIDHLVARHYAGPSRSLLTREAMPALLDRGLLQHLAATTIYEAN